MRQVGLDGESMYSVENIAFKLLRNNGHIRKLSNIQDYSYDFMHTIESNPTITLTISNNLDEKRKKKKKE